MAKRFIAELEEEWSRLEEQELDTVMSFLVYTLMEKTSLEMKEIYQFVYGAGRKIIWH